MSDDYDDRKFDDAMITQMKTMIESYLLFLILKRVNGDLSDMKEF